MVPLLKKFLPDNELELKVHIHVLVGTSVHVSLLGPLKAFYYPYKDP